MKYIRKKDDRGFFIRCPTLEMLGVMKMITVLISWREENDSQHGFPEVSSERTINPVPFALFLEPEGCLVGLIIYFSLHCISCFLMLYGTLKVS
jgi:hypothetical protein